MNVTLRVNDALPVPLTTSEYVPVATELMNVSGLGPLCELTIEPLDPYNASVSFGALLKRSDALSSPVPTVRE